MKAIFIIRVFCTKHILTAVIRLRVQLNDDVLFHQFPQSQLWRFYPEGSTARIFYWFSQNL